MQHSPAGFPDPQKHISPFPQHSPYILSAPQVGQGFAINFAFCASSIFFYFTIQLIFRDLSMQWVYYTLSRKIKKAHLLSVPFLCGEGGI
jgi:hypothetical protein